MKGRSIVYGTLLLEILLSLSRHNDLRRPVNRYDPPDHPERRTNVPSLREGTEKAIPGETARRGAAPRVRGSGCCGKNGWQRLPVEPVGMASFYFLGPFMIAWWLMFQPPPRAVYRDTSVLACW